MTRESFDEPERDTVLFTGSAEIANAAIVQVTSCEGCNPDGAEFDYRQSADGQVQCATMWPQTP